MKYIYAWIRKLYIIIKIFTWEIIQLTCLILKKMPFICEIVVHLPKVLY